MKSNKSIYYLLLYLKGVKNILKKGQKAHAGNTIKHIICLHPCWIKLYRKWLNKWMLMTVKLFYYIVYWIQLNWILNERTMSVAERWGKCVINRENGWIEVNMNRKYHALIVIRIVWWVRTADVVWLRILANQVLIIVAGCDRIDSCEK